MKMSWKKCHTNLRGVGGTWFCFELQEFEFHLFSFALCSPYAVTTLFKWQPLDTPACASCFSEAIAIKLLDRGVKLLYRSLWIGLQTGDSNITPIYKKRSADSSAQRSSLEYCQSPLWFQAFINLLLPQEMSFSFPASVFCTSYPFLCLTVAFYFPPSIPLVFSNFHFFPLSHLSSAEQMSWETTNIDINSVFNASMRTSSPQEKSV